MIMKNPKNHRRGSRSLGDKVKEFFAWLRGFRPPKYVPQKSRYGIGGNKIRYQKPDK